MPFDSDKFAKYLRQHAAGHSQAHCAKAVRRALQAAGADTRGHPVNAKDYGWILMRNGFHEVPVADPSTFSFMKGDVAIIEPTEHGNPAGHIEGFDGKAWISDFVQSGFWPGPAYSKEEPSYVVYRQ